MTGPLVLDNEAVQALRDPRHRKHRRAIAVVEALWARGRGSRVPLVPTAVRVEAGWNRRARESAVINRLRVADVLLDGEAADRAAVLVRALGVSVADAHLGATLPSVPTCAVLTSDVDDVRRIAAHLDLAVTVIGL
ncbi:MAG: hypothetical protein L0I24_09530 [Pseudonocardia sp.]|nr:hypothetical protein [Actinomycetes bacterium]MDN5931288.1 hypothetical protein [Pseudonocardia sp.]